MAGCIRIVVAAPSLLMRNVLRDSCEQVGVVTVGEASTARGLVEVCRELRPDVVVTEASLQDGEVDERLALILDAGSRLLVLCDDCSPERLTSLLAEGVSGCLLHENRPDQVAEAVLAVASGAAALHPIAAGTILRQWRRLRSQPAFLYPRPRAVPTPREHEVLVAMADGLPTEAIARRLGVSTKTVKSHKTRIFDKLGARTQAQAVSLAIGHGLLQR
ncbi:MAG TPA: response regulator transcription factor [Acidimicrobiales bacterium]|nr:response regulator transcription factor [Acidimicrobiales bacterium]